MELILIFILLLLLNILVIHFVWHNHTYNKIVLIGLLALAIIFISFLVIFNTINKPPIKNIKNSKKTTIERFQNGGGIKSKSSKLKDICGLPDNYSGTDHCFADGTHHTCCMLGEDTRKGADGSGNPIGEAAIKAYLKKHNMTRSQFNIKNKQTPIMTPWCTCTGSSVCSQYSRKYGDTKIKLINNPKSKTEIAEHPDHNCEKFYRDTFSVVPHLTPGVNNDISKYNIEKCSKRRKKITKHI